MKKHSNNTIGNEKWHNVQPHHQHSKQRVGACWNWVFSIDRLRSDNNLIKLPIIFPVVKSLLILVMFVNTCFELWLLEKHTNPTVFLIFQFNSTAAGERCISLIDLFTWVKGRTGLVECTHLKLFLFLYFIILCNKPPCFFPPLSVSH